MMEVRKVLGSLQKNSEDASERGGCRCGRTGRALTRDGEAIARAGAGDEHALRSQNANKPDVSQRRAGGSGARHHGTGNADAHTHGL